MVTRLAVWILTFACIQLLIALSNWWAIRRLQGTLDESDQPFVSILVPARNEEDNIFDCIDSLCRQNYSNYEVLVLDDQSDDATGILLAGLARTFPQLRVLSGSDLPDGWYGKHWACWQLAEQAKGTYILFTDADTRHEPSMLQATMATVEENDCDLLTAVVTQEMRTWGERLTVSFPVWSMMTLCPVWVGRRFGLPAFSVVNGQFMLFRRSTYMAVDGHRGVKNHAVDDMALGRQIIRKGFRWALYDGSALVRCRMYRSLGEALHGFTKNYFALFDYHVGVAVFIWMWMLFVSSYPLLLSGMYVFGRSLPALAGPTALVALLVQTLLWLLTIIRIRMPWSLLVLHPLIGTLASVIGLASIVLTIQGRTVWKGRQLDHVAVKWPRSIRKN